MDDVTKYQEMTEQLSGIYQQCLYQACAAVEITPSQYFALSTLTALGCVPMSRVAAELELSPGSASMLVDRLHCRGLVERLDDPDDRRKVCVRVSTKGTRILKKANQLKGDRLSEPFGRLTPAMRQRVLEGLTALLEVWA